MIKFEKIKPGMELLDVHSHSVGNTTMTALGCWTVKILAVDDFEKTAVVSWNGNAAQIWRRARLERLYVTPPKKYRDQKERKRKAGMR